MTARAAPAKGDSARDAEEAAEFGAADGPVIHLAASPSPRASTFQPERDVYARCDKTHQRDCVQSGSKAQELLERSKKFGLILRCA